MLPHKGLLRGDDLADEDRPFLTGPLGCDAKLVDEDVERAQGDEVLERVEPREPQAEDVEPVLGETIKARVAAVRQVAIPAVLQVARILGLEEGNELIPGVLPLENVGEERLQLRDAARTCRASSTGARRSGRN